MHIQRRPLIAGGVALMAAPRITFPQPARKLWRIGVLSTAWPERWATTQWLTSSGYVEGQDFVLDYKYVGVGQQDRRPALAAELVANKSDVLIGDFNPDIAALKAATSAIPILMRYAMAPVEMGYVLSLAKPGGNVTGTATNVPRMVGKMVQALRDAVPAIKSVVMLADLSFPGFNLYVEWFDAAATRLGLTGKVIDTRTWADLDMVVAAFEREKPDAIFVSMIGVVGPNFVRITQLAARRHIPVLYGIRYPVEWGGLMSYSADFKFMDQRNAWQLDRILRGAKPSDIPVEEPARFLLTINLKTAKAMGLVIPQSVLLQADEIIG